MRDIPIIYSAPMVLALWQDLKTMTRRLAWARDGDPRASFSHKPSVWQRVKPGDRLWVRESLRRSSPEGHWLYAADGVIILMERTDPRVSAMVAWAHHKERDYCTAIHMPRWASRLTLIVTATKIERLQDISEKDAIAEGVTKVRDNCYVVKGFDYDTAGLCHSRAVIPFAKLWEHLHGPDSWDANPEVVCLSFKVHKVNIDAMPKAEAA